MIPILKYVEQMSKFPVQDLGSPKYEHCEMETNIARESLIRPLISPEHHHPSPNSLKAKAETISATNLSTTNKTLTKAAQSPHQGIFHSIPPSLLPRLRTRHGRHLVTLPHTAALLLFVRRIISRWWWWEKGLLLGGWDMCWMLVRWVVERGCDLGRL